MFKYIVDYFNPPLIKENDEFDDSIKYMEEEFVKNNIKFSKEINNLDKYTINYVINAGIFEFNLIIEYSNIKIIHKFHDKNLTIINIPKNICNDKIDALIRFLLNYISYSNLTIISEFYDDIKILKSEIEQLKNEIQKINQ